MDPLRNADVASGGRCRAVLSAVIAAAVSAVLFPAIVQAQYDARHYELSIDDRARLDALRRSQDEQDARHRAEMKAFRAKLLRSAPLPDRSNVLLGRWRVEGSGKPRPKDDMSQLMGIITNPGGFGCEVLFGGGVTEFLPRSWASIDGYGNDSLGPIAYRAVGRNMVAAIPDKGVEMLIFEVAGPNRIEFMEGCALVRVGAPAASAAASPASPAVASGKPPSSSPTKGLSTADLQVAAIAPTAPPATPARPSDDVCRLTVLDKLGAVGVNQVRQMADRRFRETIDGKVPNSQHLRIDARGSGCDDPRLNATLFDFDANGMLQSITYVWARPAGPAPAPIFSERVRSLSLHHRLPPPQSPGRLQADTSLGRLVLQDMPERGLLLEAYGARR